ncbi:MAG: DSD1 family PLP-dependent enzyme [Syntrophothermus sp.]
MNTAVKNKTDLDTPCLVLDLDILEEKLKRVQSIAAAAGKALRPHAKTHKCSSLAKLQIEHGAIGICAAKVSEAEVLAKAGIKGILITGPVSTRQKMEKLADILEVTPEIIAVVDNPACIKLLSQVLKERGLSIEVLLDINAGLNRTGVEPEDAPSIAGYISSFENLRLRGIQAYAGHVQHITDFAERKNTSHKCLSNAVEVFRQLKTVFEKIDIFSASGTGTFAIDSEIPEITEFQVGSYVSMDAEYLAVQQTQVNNEAASLNSALHLMTSVVSTNQSGFVTVDAGLKSLYKDGGQPIIISPEYTNLQYDWFGDEYGKLISNDNSCLPPIGTVIELITSHCDPTINLFDRFYLTRGNEVVGSWDIDLRGCSR